MKVGRVWTSRRSMTVDHSGPGRKQLREVADHDVRSMSVQRVGVASSSRYSDHQAEAAVLSSLHAGDSVLDDAGALGLDLELSRCCQEHVRLRFSPQAQVRRSPTVNTDLEKRLDFGRLEYRRAVFT